MPEAEIKNSNGYLEGQLLIATPMILESCFYRSVIYMVVHNETGGMGIVINYQLHNIKIQEILEQLNIPFSKRVMTNIPVQFGGPLEPARGFVLHTSEYYRPETIQMAENLALTSNIEVLQDIASGKGPEKCILALGYAGWAPGQLEKEIEENSWISVEATEELVFDIPNKDKWIMTAQSIGIDPMLIAPDAGHA